MIRNRAWAAGAGEGPAAHCVRTRFPEARGLRHPRALPKDIQGKFAPGRWLGRGAWMQFGRYFEEFEVGAVYRHWPGKTVTEADDHLFCLLTMNHHPLHIDAHYAQGTEFGR